MIKYFPIFGALVVISLASVAILQAELNQFTQLELGTEVRTWGRTVGGKKEYLKACADNDNSNKCIHWSDEKGNVISSTSRSRVFNNGSLIIYSFQKADVGGYFSPDERERVVELSENSFGALPRTLINLIHMFV
ncbi:unnamed protein product, partial [Mesorhabditis belari]|uniref:Uncharacterized protein n=1 Tax=Mesorhabditis belari TaxID=2138241 RepID=A0AAF3FK37_9BILA